MQKTLFALGAVVLFSLCTAFSVYAPYPADKVKWVTIDQLEALQQQEPRKVLVDIYTSWCGFCKKMDKETYAHPQIADYMNEKFYAIRFDAESKLPVNFKGETYRYITKQGAGINELTLEWLGSDLQFPSTVVLNEKLSKLNVVPGYLSPENMDKVLHYYGDDFYKKRIPFNMFSSKYRSTLK